MTQEGHSLPALKIKLERGAPDDEFVSKLAQVKLATAAKENELAKNDAEFRTSIEETLASGGRRGYIQICAPFELYAISRLVNARSIVEVGVSAGVSSAYLLRAMQSLAEKGTLHSIDLPESEDKEGPGASWSLPKGKETGWAIPSDLKKNWDLRLGKSRDVLPGLMSRIGRVDVFLYDVPYEIEEAIEDFKVVDRKLHSGSIVLADNCLAPITWWAKRRRARLYARKRSGLRGFRVP